MREEIQVQTDTKQSGNEFRVTVLYCNCVLRPRFDILQLFPLFFQTPATLLVEYGLLYVHKQLHKEMLYDKLTFERCKIELKTMKLKTNILKTSESLTALDHIARKN